METVKKTYRYHDRLKMLMDKLAHLVYDITQSFPAEERYGLTSQVRRAAISVVLNYVEGYARQTPKQYKQFLDISYGSI